LSFLVQLAQIFKPHVNLFFKVFTDEVFQPEQVLDFRLLSFDFLFNSSFIRFVFF